MKEFSKQQWEDYSERLNNSAIRYAGDDDSLREQFVNEAKDFVEGQSISDYGSLLKAMAKGSELVLEWRSKSPVVDESAASTS